MLSLTDSLQRWKSMMDWMQDPVLAGNEALLSFDERVKNRDSILDRIDTWASAFTKVDLVEEAQRRHIPVSPVNTSLDLAADVQLIDRGFLVDAEHPVYGPMRFPRGAIATVWNNDVGFAPELGSANRELLAELGYANEQN